MIARVSVREKRILNGREVRELLGEQVSDDCIAAGWLKPCAVKENPTRDRKVYSMRDIETCEARMEQGEYPQP